MALNKILRFQKILAIIYADTENATSWYPSAICEISATTFHEETLVSLPELKYSSTVYSLI